MELTPEEESIIEEGLEALSRGCYSEPSKTKAYENLLKKFKKAKGLKLPLIVQESRGFGLVHIADASGETVFNLWKKHDVGHKLPFTLVVENALSKAKQLVRCVNSYGALVEALEEALSRESNPALCDRWQRVLNQAKEESNEES